METFTIMLIIVTLTIILFSSFSYSYISQDTNGQIPIDQLNTVRPQTDNKLPKKYIPDQINNVGKINPNASSYALFNLPEKDEYMTTDLRNQIDTLRTQYYYDNCKYTSIPK